MKVDFSKEENGHGKFMVNEAGQEVARIEFRLNDKIMTVLHTEVDPSVEGKGFAKLMLSSLTDYARTNGLKVKPLCPFVYGQFKKLPELYNDIWLQTA